MLFRSFEARYGIEQAKVRARRVVTICWAVLIVITLTTGLVIAHQGGTDTLLPVLLRLLPLVLLGAVLRTERRRGYGWLAFVSVLYLVQGAAILQLPGFWWLGLLEVLAALALLLSAGSYVYQIHGWQKNGG